MNWFGVRVSGAGLAVTALALVLLGPPAASLYYESGDGEQCARCHEIRPQYEAWANSAHRKVPCSGCHGDALTLDPGFHLNNLHRVSAHVKGDVPEQVRMRGLDIVRVVERCARCHRNEYAEWKTGPHAATLARIFLTPEHNRKRLLMDDCLRCHGSWYEGGIRDLVSPLDTKGPWQLRDAALKDLPAMPCTTCHQMHRAGSPLPAPKEVQRPSIALFDRREMRHMAGLPVPAIHADGRALKMSPDPRQGLCYQCHAPEPAMQAGSGDDRTGRGVHEGLSCFACHQKHGQSARASCANCHPRLSNCGLDVEKMDTTFRDKKSLHNVHSVKCSDCHGARVPAKKVALAR